MVRIALQNGDIQLARKTGGGITRRNGPVKWKAEGLFGVLLHYKSRVHSAISQLAESRTPILLLTWWPYRLYLNAKVAATGDQGETREETPKRMLATVGNPANKVLT